MTAATRSIRRLTQTPLQPARAIDKFLRNFESPGQMRSQRFYAEDFRGIMSAEQKIHAELFSSNGGPVRSFASDKRIDVFLRDPIDLRARGAGHNADRARLLRAKIENFHRAIQCSPQFTNQFAARH